jgi:hypothetical protein
MVFADLFFVLVLALVLAAILAAVFGRPSWGGFIFVFLILFFATWAGGLWVRPIGIPVFGITWLSYVLVGMFVALLLAAFIPRSGPTRHETGAGRSDRPDNELVAVNVFFWVLISLLVLSIVIAYVRTPPAVI